MTRSYDYIIDLLNRFDHAEPYALDPAGTRALARSEASAARGAPTRGTRSDVARASRSVISECRLVGLALRGEAAEPLYPAPARDTSS